MKNNYLIAVTDDLFDIADRLKTVNPAYSVFYNVVCRRYEVHSGVRRGETSTLAFVVPYDELDARMVEYAQKTSVANAARLIEEMQRNNDAVELTAEKIAVEQTMARLDKACSAMS